MNLAGASVDLVGDELVAMWSWTGDVPAEGTLLLSTNVYREGLAERLLGLKFLGGRPIAQYVFWWRQGSQDDLPLDFEIDEAGQFCTVRYPAVLTEGLPSQLKWQSVLNVDGRDVGLVNSETVG